MTSSRKPASLPSRAPEGGDLRAHPRPSGRRILFFSFLTSAVLHLAIILLYPRVMDRAPDLREPDAPAPEEVTDALRLLTLRDPVVEEDEPVAEPPEAESVEEVAPEPDPEPDPEPEVEVEVEPEPAAEALPPTPEAEAAEPPPTAAQRLQPHMVDPRLWREVGPGTELSDMDRARIRVYGLMEAWADSVAVLEEAERRALDWTYTDDEGRRWGISPGRLHLGEFSLPLPIHFNTPPGLRDEVERRGWEWAEIERGAASAAVRDALQDRAREIRTRRDAERGDTLRSRP